MRKFILQTILAVGVAAGTMQAADVVVRAAPPRVMVERRPVAPGRGYVWIGGYQRWDGRAYIWVPGRWERPPRAHAVWVAPRWRHVRGGYVFVEGRWR